MDIRRRMLFNKKKASSGGGSTTGGSYTVNLNNEWEETTAVPNPDSTLYDGVYRSASSYNVNNGVSIMYITIYDCSSFKMYIRSYAESSWDYMMVSQLDQTINGNTSYSNTTLVKAHTRGNQQYGTALSSYTLVEFTGIPSGMHTITVVYRKDSSVNSGDDRGYVLIPKSNGSSGSEEGGEGGDVEIDTTYAIYYTSSDGNIVTPYKTTGFGSNIVSNVYVNGQGIISFDGPVTTLGYEAFDNCSSLTSITIPDSVTDLRSGAFDNCSSMTKFISQLSEDNGRILVFDGVLTYFAPAGLTEYNIPNSVRWIKDSAFKNCDSLTSVTIPDSVTTIGSSAFFDCDRLISITIGNSVTDIQASAFSSCDSLTSITIPDSVTKIGNYAFSDCRNMTSVYCKATTPPSLGQGAFKYWNGSGSGYVPYGCDIYVPTASVEAYKTSEYWSEYANDIVGYNF